VQWTIGGIKGAWRLVNRLWDEFDSQPHEVMSAPPGADAQAVALIRATHRLVKMLTAAIEGFHFNTGVARVYEFLDLLKSLPASGASPELLTARATALSALARVIAPYAPHLAEECWARIGGEGMVVEAPWPRFDPALAADEELVLPVQINGKRRGEIRAAPGTAETEVEKIALADLAVRRHLEGMDVRKVIVVKDRIINIVAG